MKTNLLRAPTVLITCAGTLVSAWLCLAAPAPETPKPGRVWALDISDGLLRLDNTQVDATLENIINSLREEYPANLAVAPGLSRVKVQDLKLSSFRWEQALEALRVASGGAFRWEKKLANPTEESQEDLLILMPEVIAGMPGGRGLEVFNLASYLKNQDQKEIELSLKEIQEMMAETMKMLEPTGPEADRGAIPPQFKFHPGARLFVVVGEGEALEAARKVLLALPGVTSSHSPYAYGRPAETPPGPVPSAPPGAPMQPFLQRYGIAPAAPLAPGSAGGRYGGAGGTAGIKPPAPGKPELAPPGAQKY